MENYYVPLSQGLIYVVAAGIIWSVHYGLNKSLVFQGVDEIKRKKIIFYVIGGLLIWLSIISLIAYSGFYLDFETLPPKIATAIVPPILLSFLLCFSSKFSNFLKGIPPAWLIYAQTFRFFVEIILWLGFLGGFVPFQMTFEGFNFDIIVGLTAISGGLLFFGKNRFRKFEAIIWNVSGLALLINILTIAIISSPSPVRVFFNEPANRIVAYFPYIWIPGFFVPFGFAMHFFSLKQLIFMKREGKREFSLKK